MYRIVDKEEGEGVKKSQNIVDVICVSPLGLFDQLVPHQRGQLGQVLDLAAHEALESSADVLEEVPRPHLQNGAFPLIFLCSENKIFQLDS